MLSRRSFLPKCVCLLVVAAAALVACVPATQAKAKAKAKPKLVIGVSDNSPSMFTSSYFKKAKFATVREQVPWNVAVTKSKIALGAAGIWIDDAVNEGIQPMVSFTSVPGPDADQAPTLAQYTRAVKAFMKVFPMVKVYSPWNEPDFIYNELGNDPQLAAGYYNAMVSACRSCTIVAGDVYRPANDGLAAWVKTYSRYLKTQPKAWALHPYDDVRSHTTAAIRALASVTKGPIWLDEIAGVERRQKWPFPNQLPAQANNDERFLFSLPKQFPRIQRIYHFQWRATKAATWDSALLGEEGKPRPAYWTDYNAIRGKLP